MKTLTIYRITFSNSHGEDHKLIMANDITEAIEIFNDLKASRILNIEVLGVAHGH